MNVKDNPRDMGTVLLTIALLGFAVLFILPLFDREWGECVKAVFFY